MATQAVRLAKADVDGDIVDYQGRKLATVSDVANRLRFDLAQTLNVTQRNQALANLGLDPATLGGTPNDGSVTAAKLASGAVTDAKVATGISADKISNGTLNKVLTATLATKLTAVPTQLVPIIARTSAQGVPTAAECAALGLPDGTLITVDPI